MGILISMYQYVHYLPFKFYTVKKKYDAFIQLKHPLEDVRRMEAVHFSLTGCGGFSGFVDMAS